MIVAVGDFNMGAMENKGLNIFNTKFVLARPDTATDDGLLSASTRSSPTSTSTTGPATASPAATGSSSRSRKASPSSATRSTAPTSTRAPSRASRTCATCASASSPRTRARWRTRCAPTPTSRSTTSTPPPSTTRAPRSCACIHTLLGKDGFRRGMDLYFERHDGQAVTCDDFRAAMADANGADLAQFGRWYSQAGTPVVECRGEYDARTRDLHAARAAVVPAHAGAGREAPVPYPARRGPRRPRRGATCRCGSRARPSPRAATTGAPPCWRLREAEQTLRVRRRAGAPGALAASRFLRAGARCATTTPTRSSRTSWRTTATRSTAGRRARCSRRASCSPACESAARRARDGGPAGVRRGDGPRALATAPRDPAFAAECLHASRARASSPSDGRRRSRCDPRGAHARSCREIADRYRTRFEGAFRHFTVAGALFTRRRRRGPPRAAQRRARAT